MGNSPELVVMLTHHDRTVENAYEIFDQCKNTRAKYWGFKEEPMPLPMMRKLFDYMKECGKITSLEVVAYTEEECLRGAKMAVTCGCDYLLGTSFFDSVNDLCLQNGLRYMPFVGKVSFVSSMAVASPIRSRTLEVALLRHSRVKLSAANQSPEHVAKRLTPKLMYEPFVVNSIE